MKSLIDRINRFSLGTRIVGVAFVAIFLTGLSGLVMNRFSLEKFRVSAIQNAVEKQKNITKTIENAGKVNYVLARLLASRDDVKKALAERDRDALFKIARPFEEMINQDYDFKLKIHFHIPPCQSFCKNVEV